MSCRELGNPSKAAAVVRKSSKLSKSCLKSKIYQKNRSSLSQPPISSYCLNRIKINGKASLFLNPFSIILRAMSVIEIIREIKALAEQERLDLMERLYQVSEADIPESLRQSMAEAERGELMDLDEALKDLDKE